MHGPNDRALDRKQDHMKARAKQSIEPVIDVPDPPDVALVLQYQSAVSEWFGGLRQFYREAQDLELQGQSALSHAQRLTVPTNGSQDAQLQDLVRSWNAGKKGVESHWYAVTNLFDKLHERAVAFRKRGVTAYTEASTIGTRLHNSYVEAERRRAREEEDRLRREAEDRARKDRERELQALEDAAMKAEAESPILSKREDEFVLAFTALRGFTVANAPGSARHAGYKDPDNAALRLMRSPKIQAAIQAVYDARSARQQAQAVHEMPVAVEDVVVQPDIVRGGDRTTWSGEIVNEGLVIDACIRGEAPRYLLRIDPVKVNELARSMHEKLDTIPGLRHKKKTGIV